MKKVVLCTACAISFLVGRAQLVIEAGSTVFLESGAKLIVQGNMASASAIQGTGTVVMKGTSPQTLSMNGNTVPNLEIDNPANVSLDGSHTRIGTSLIFTNGKLLTATQDLFLAPEASVSGHGASRFIWTSGIGQVKKELTTNFALFEMPVGENDNYRPVYLTTEGGTYAAGANIGVRNVSGASANRPPSVASLVTTHWPVTKTGITGGTQTVAAAYVDPADVTGTEGTLRGYYFDGTDWTSGNSTHDAAANRISARLTTATGEVTAMNKFLAIGARAFLQGAFRPSDGLMSDALRTPSNIIPLNDPYRTAPYSNYFSHISNSITEVAAAGVFSDQSAITSASDNIVDWVFLQLRNTNPSPGNGIVQTRSALIQRDGDIVDIDGKSPVTFNNVPDGNYVLTIRHRNHLGLSTDNMTAANWRTFTEQKSLAFAGNVVDFRTEATEKIFGGAAAYTTASYGGNTYKLLWAGDISGNGAIRFQGASPGQPNDRVLLLQDLGNNESNSLNSYHRGDVNLNRNTRYSGSSGPGQLNDRLFILQQVLLNNESALKTQSIPH
jgi:hypothetical protein